MNTIDQTEKPGAALPASEPTEQVSGPGPLDWRDDELLDAALSARRTGVSVDDVRDAFGSGAARLTAVAEQLLVGGAQAAPAPDQAFVLRLEQDVGAAFDSRSAPASSVPWLVKRVRVRHAAAIATVAVVASLAAVLVVSSPAGAPGGAPTAVAATGTATDATPEARATLSASAGAVGVAARDCGPDTANVAGSTSRPRRSGRPAALATVELPTSSGVQRGEAEQVEPLEARRVDAGPSRSVQAWMAPALADGRATGPAPDQRRRTA